MTVDNTGPTTSGVDILFIETVAQAGGLAYLDGVSVHPYRNGGPESVLADWVQLDGVIDKYYIPSPIHSRPRLVSGEWGYPSCANSTTGGGVPCSGGGGAGPDPLTQQEQAARLVRQRCLNDLAGVAITIWYDWQDDGTDRTLGEFNYGTIHNQVYANASYPAGAPKPAYLAALTSSELLGGCVLVQRLNSSTPGSFALAYRPLQSSTPHSIQPLGIVAEQQPRSPVQDEETLLLLITSQSSHPQQPERAHLQYDYVHIVWDPAADVNGSTATITIMPDQAPNQCFEVKDMYGHISNLRLCAAGGQLVLPVYSDPQYLI
jgi:hypothetical protein